MVFRLKAVSDSKIVLKPLATLVPWMKLCSGRSYNPRPTTRRDSESLGLVFRSPGPHAGNDDICLIVAVVNRVALNDEHPDFVKVFGHLPFSWKPRKGFHLIQYQSDFLDSEIVGKVCA